VRAEIGELHLKSSRFRMEREDDWLKLEKLLARVEKTSLRSLSEEEIVSLTVLYRSTLSSLSVARATSLDHALVDYLESLSTRAYFFVYGARTTLLSRIGRFFARDWPLAVQGLWRETLVALFVTLLGVGVAYLLVSNDPDWYYAFVPRGLAHGRDPSASTEFLRKSLYDGGDMTEFLSIFATQLFTNNTQVAILAFALGFAFGAPTILLLLHNGCIAGAMIALYVSHGLGFGFSGWLLVHGVTEISAVILAGAAGLRIGWALAFPGVQTRTEAAGAAGRQAALAMCGVVLMLLVACLLESFARTLITEDWARYAIAVVSALAWGGYLYLPRSTGAVRRTPLLTPRPAHG
jgi:uncharacterized membrane protein SpoIIM required for sporulation